MQNKSFNLGRQNNFERIELATNQTMKSSLNVSKIMYKCILGLKSKYFNLTQVLNTKKPSIWEGARKNNCVLLTSQDTPRQPSN